MSRFNRVQATFDKGEISPSGQGRIDVQEYFQGCSRLENFLPLESGPAYKRGGFKVVDNEVIPAAISNCGLFEIHTSDDTKIAIAFDWSSMAFHAIDTFTGADISVNQFPYTTVYPTIPRVDNTRFTYVVIADAILGTHLDGRVPPFVLQWNGTALTLHPFSRANPYRGSPLAQVMMVPFRDVNIDPIILTPSWTTGDISVTSNVDFFQEGHVGAIFKLNQGGTTGAIRITSYTDPRSVGARVLNTLENASGTDNWEESAWSDYRGWPRTITSHQQRIVFGGNDSEPDTLWASRIGNYFHMMARKFEQDATSDTSGLNYFGDAAETDPFVFRLASTKRNYITWLQSLRTLNIGTELGQFIATGSDEVLSALSVAIVPQTSWSSERSHTAVAGNEVIYISDQGQGIRNFKYSESNGSNISQDLTVASKEIFRHNMNDGVAARWGVRKVLFHAEESILWGLTNANQLVGMRYSETTGSNAWFRITVGGEFSGVASQVEDIAIIGGELFALIKRTNGSGNRRTLERLYMPKVFSSNLSTVLQYNGRYYNFLDGSIEVVSTDATTISGLDHLEGLEVTVVKDGVVLGEYIVTAGAITFDQQPGEHTYIVGLKYTSVVDTLDIEAGGDFGASQGDRKKCSKVVAKYHATFDGKIGLSGGNLATRSFGDDLFSGYKEYDIETKPDFGQIIRIQSTEPYPCNILLLALKGVNYAY